MSKYAVPIFIDRELDSLVKTQASIMPIKSLESFLFERKLVSTGAVEILQNATIGIDVEHYLGRIYTFKKEQLLAGIGGVPISLRAYIQSDLEVFSEFNIRPIFVIPGLPIAPQVDSSGASELQEQHREATWNRIQAKTINSALPHFYSSESFRYHAEPLPYRPMVNELIKCFVDAKIDYFVCPYDASFQLSYMYENNLIDSIYGSTDLLLTHVDKFILGMEFQSKDFRFVDKNKILNELDLTERQFLDISLMIGCSVQPETFPNLPKLPKSNPSAPFPQPSYFKIGLDIVYQLKSFNPNTKDLFGYISSFNDPNLVSLYFKGHAAIKYMPIMNQDGYVDLYVKEMASFGYKDEADFKIPESLSVESPESIPHSEKHSELKIPAEIHDVISQRLPPEVHLYFSLGLVSSSFLEAITHGTITIRPPIEGGPCDTYKALVSSDESKTLIESQLNLLTQLLTRYYQVKRVKLDYWFLNTKSDLNIRLQPPLFVKLLNLKLKYNLPDFLLNGALESLRGIKTQETYSQEIVNTDDVIYTALLRAFNIHGILDTSFDLTKIGRTLCRFVEKTEKKVDQKYMELLILLLLLLKTNSGKKLFSADALSEYQDRFKDKTHTTEFGNKERISIALMSRIVSLRKFDIQAINYQGPLSRGILSFRSHVEFIHTSFLNSIEVCLIDLVARLSAFKLDKLDRSQWYEIIQKMPFYGSLNNTLLGVMTEIYLEKCVKMWSSNGPDSQCKDLSLKYLLEEVLQLNNVSHNINLNSVNAVSKNQVISNLNSGFQFWKWFSQLCQIAFEEDQDLVSRELLGLIQDAEALTTEFQNLES